MIVSGKIWQAETEPPDINLTWKKLDQQGKYVDLFVFGPNGWEPSSDNSGSGSGNGTRVPETDPVSMPRIIDLENKIPANSSTSNPLVDTNTLNSAVGSKQATLSSGVNIKTVNGQSLLGSGNLSVTANVNGTQVPVSSTGHTYVTGATVQAQLDSIDSELLKIEKTSTALYAVVDALPTVGDPNKIYITHVTPTTDNPSGLVQQTYTPGVNGAPGTWSTPRPASATFDTNTIYTKQESDARFAPISTVTSLGTLQTAVGQNTTSISSLQTKEQSDIDSANAKITTLQSSVAALQASTAIPTNMVTTNTVQTITADKTFSGTNTVTNQTVTTESVRDLSVQNQTVTGSINLQNAAKVTNSPNPTQSGDLVPLGYMNTAIVGAISAAQLSGGSGTPYTPTAGSITSAMLDTSTNAALTKANNSVQKSGDTMTGTLVLPATTSTDSTALPPNQAATMRDITNAIQTQRSERSVDMSMVEGQMANSVTSVTVTGDTSWNTTQGTNGTFDVSYRTATQTYGPQTIKIKGLNTAAYRSENAFATADQGRLASTAIQPDSTTGKIPDSVIPQSILDAATKTASITGTVDLVPVANSANLVQSGGVAAALANKQTILPANTGTETVIIGQAPNTTAGTAQQYGMSDIVNAVVASNNFQTSVQTVSAQTISGTTPPLDSSQQTILVSPTTELTSGSGWTVPKNGALLITNNSLLGSTARLLVNGVEKWADQGLGPGTNSSIVYVSANDVVTTSGSRITSVVYEPLAAALPPAGAVPLTRTINGKSLSTDITLNATDVGAATPASVNTAQAAANTYTDTQISGLSTKYLPVNGTAANSNLLNSHPDTYFLHSTSIKPGTVNGTLVLTTNGNDQPAVTVPGLGTAAFTPIENYATALQGSKADTAYQMPTGKIPISDLNQTVQDKINLAGTSLASANAYTDSKLATKLDTSATAINSNMLNNQPASYYLHSASLKNGTTQGTLVLTTNEIDQTPVNLGLGSVAYTSTSNYATAAQGTKADTAYQLPSTGIPMTSLASDVQNNIAKASTLTGNVDQIVSTGSPNPVTSGAVATALANKQNVIAANNKTETVLVGMPPNAVAGAIQEYGMSDVVSAVMASNQFQTSVQTITAQTISGTTPALDQDKQQVIADNLASSYTSPGNGGIMVSTNSTTPGAATVSVNGVQVWSNSGTTAGNSGVIYVKQGDVVTSTGLTSAVYAPLMGAVAPAGTVPITRTINGKPLSDNITLTATDVGAISTETDPTVPSWAKQATKPTYTASEVGALPSTTLYAGSTTAGGAANSVANSLTIQQNGVTSATYNGSSAQTVNITPAGIGAVTTTQLGNYVQKPATAITAGNIISVDSNGNLVDTGTNGSMLTTMTQKVTMPGSTVSVTTWVNMNVGNRATIGMSTGGPFYYVLRQVPTGTLTADQEVGMIGRLTFTGTNQGSISDIEFIRGAGNYINRAIINSGAGLNGYQELNLTEPLFARDANNNQFMVLRITTSSDGNLAFAGKSIGGLVEGTMVECLNQSQFSAKYTVIQDCNPWGENLVYNPGYEQLTGEYWTTSDGKKFRIFRATMRAKVAADGATAPFERQWLTLNNIYLFLGFDAEASMLQGVYNGVNYYFPINFYDASDTLAISTTANIQGTTLRASTKVNPKDGNYQMWNISNNNALFSFYYLKSNDAATAI